MTQQFRPGQRVRVHPQDWALPDANGVVLGVRFDGAVNVSLPGELEWDWFQPDELTLIPFPGIPAHLVRTDTDPASRHWPVWRA